MRVIPCHRRITSDPEIKQRPDNGIWDGKRVLAAKLIPILPEASCPIDRTDHNMSALFE